MFCDNMEQQYISQTWKKRQNVIGKNLSLPQYFNIYS